MKVVIWPALGRVGSYATGVGRHVLRMSTGLAARSGWDARLLFTSDLWAKEASRAEPSLMDVIPGVRLPFNRRFGELCWRRLGAPALDRWVEGTDWVYCPKELYVPVRESRYAVTVHDLYRLEPEFRQRSGKSEYRWSHLLERALQEADLVLSVSEFTSRRLVELIGLEPGKIRVVGNGIEERFFATGRDGSNSDTTIDGEPYLLSIGGVTRKKGAVNLLAAASELARVAPQLTLVIVGPVEPGFAPQVAEAPNIRVMRRGFPDSEMHQLVRNAAALLILSEYEGFGIPALEAMAAGVPVVAADRAALPEVVGEAGLLVEPTDSEAVAQTIVNLIEDADARTDLVAKGRARAEQYRWDSCVERLCLALEEFSTAPSSVAAG